MRRLGVVLLVLIAFAAGFGLGRRDDGERHTRGSGRTAAGRRAEAAQYRESREHVETIRQLRTELGELRTRMEALAPAEPATPPPGTRLPDGTIVGGAKWTDSFVSLATGFVDSIINGFVRDAKLTAEQERRLRETVRGEAKRFTQVSADFTNGDIDGDTAYAQLEVLAAEARQKVRQLLNEDQVETFEKFQGTIRNIMRRQIVHNEMATLKSTLRLDSDQEKRVLAIVEERYQRIDDSLNTPIPNVFFKPLRRKQDEDVYKQTADEIRSILAPDQKAAFDKWESKAPDEPFQYRTQLIPK
ncbi:MAG: hypothetical protein ACYS0E_00470 [Planctomycetota bacterium]|jgi:hypothetical protein